MAKQQAGFFLSVPVYGQVDPIITRIVDATTLDEAREYAEEDGREAFMLAGYETMDMCYATLFQIALDGGLVFSECLLIYGPEVG